MSETPNSTSVDLQLLDASLQADPTNPNTITEIALLVAEGASATPEMVAALKKGLADGIASTITHMILANTLIEQDNPRQAIFHLEAALSKEPQNAVALNNLALALSMIEPPEIEKALELVDRALAIAGPMADIWDTKGQILMKQGNIPAAIGCFEDAVRLDGTAIESRIQLAAAYEQLGMQDLANQQLSRIAELKSNTSEVGGYP